MNVSVSEQKRRFSECKNMVLKSKEKEEENNVNGILMMCTLMIRNCKQLKKYIHMKMVVVKEKK